MADVFKAIADPTRRTILDGLAERDDQTLFEICARLANRHGLASSRQAVSQHIDVLVDAGLVTTRREGRYKFHRIDRRPLRTITGRWRAPRTGGTMRINLNSVLVDDQAKALTFYTEVLGFQLKHDIPLGEHRWLTVVSPGEPEGAELLLEPDAHPAAKQYKAALAEDGIPLTQFEVDDVEAEHARLTGLGVRFTQDPTPMGPVTTAVLDDTCGNLIQIVSAPAAT